MPLIIEAIKGIRGKGGRRVYAAKTKSKRRFSRKAGIKRNKFYKRKMKK